MFTYMPRKSWDYKFWNQRLKVFVLKCLQFILNGNHCFNTATVHKLHHQMYLTLIEKDSVVVNKQWKWIRYHIEFIVKLVPLFLVKQIDDLITFLIIKKFLLL